MIDPVCVNEVTLKGRKIANTTHRARETTREVSNQNIQHTEWIKCQSVTKSESGEDTNMHLFT